jgi:hypothetical protein
MLGVRVYVGDRLRAIVLAEGRKAGAGGNVVVEINRGMWFGGFGLKVVRRLRDRNSCGFARL